MADQSVDYSQGFNFLYQIERRVGYLEKDLLFIEKNVDLLELKGHDGFIELSEELQKIRQGMAALKNHFKECNHGMSLLGKDLKDCMKKDDIQLLSSRIDEIKFEEYVTRNDLKREME